MLFPDDDPFMPTMAQKHDALGLMAGIIASLLLGVVALDLLDVDISGAMQSIVAFVLVLVVMGPKHVAYFVNVFRFLRRGWR